MLFLKWNELRNSSKFKGSRLLGGALLTFISLPSLAQANPIASSSSQLASIFFALLVVIGLILVLAFTVKRLNLGKIHSEHIKVITSLTTGPKERLMIIDVAGEQILVGVTSQSINHIKTLEHPIDTQSDSAPMNFQGALQKVLTQSSWKGKE